MLKATVVDWIDVGDRDKQLYGIKIKDSRKAKPYWGCDDNGPCISTDKGYIQKLCDEFNKQYGTNECDSSQG